MTNLRLVIPPFTCGLETRATIAHSVSQTEEIHLDELPKWQLTATTTEH